MKQIKHFWEKSFGWTLSSLLSLLGFSACDWDDPTNDPTTYMYGTPIATFSIKGQVINPENTGLPGIQVIVANCEVGQSTTPYSTPDRPVIVHPIGDTLYTDQHGNFNWYGAAFPSDTVRYELQFNDLDSTASSPHYLADTLKVEFLAQDRIPHNNDNPWDAGSAEKKITILLNKKKNEQ